MPVITTGIIHIETDCTPAKSNAVWSIGIRVPPMMGSPKGLKSITITRKGLRLTLKLRF